MGDLGTLAGAAAAVFVAAATGFFKLLHDANSKFISVSDKIDTKTTEIVNRLTEIYDDHEKRDQDRHEQNVTRLTRLETLVNGSRPRSRRNG